MTSKDNSILSNSDIDLTDPQNQCSQTYIKRSPLRQRKSGLIRQMTSYQRFNSYEIFGENQIVLKIMCRNEIQYSIFGNY